MDPRVFRNGTYTGVPARCEVGREQCCCVIVRPEGGGPICLLHFVAGDLRDLVPPIDLRQVLPDFEDGFGAAPFVSNIDGTLKAFVNFKQAGGGNDRALEIVSTGLVPEVTR